MLNDLCYEINGRKFKFKIKTVKTFGNKYQKTEKEVFEKLSERASKIGLVGLVLGAE